MIIVRLKEKADDKEASIEIVMDGKEEKRFSAEGRWIKIEDGNDTVSIDQDYLREIYNFYGGNKVYEKEDTNR